MQHGSLQNLTLGAMLPKPNFEVGDGATLVYWTDRQAATIIAISASRRKVTIQEDIAKRTDGRGMSDAQSYDFTPNPMDLRTSPRCARMGPIARRAVRRFS